MNQLGVSCRNSYIFIKSTVPTGAAIRRFTSGSKSNILSKLNALYRTDSRHLWTRNTSRASGSYLCKDCNNILAKFLVEKNVLLHSNTSFKNSPLIVRTLSSQGRGADKKRNQTMLLYICAIGIGMVGLSYAGVPLYRMFCQATGLGGQAVRGHDVSKVGEMTKVEDRIIRIQFNADTASSMQWSFRPQQSEVKVLPGETALAFYTAKNPTDKPITGISTYNVVPFEAGQYFNKIQCFCFEEQRLNPHEKVDMPVFFYIDPEFAEDPKMAGVDRIILSYTFFEAKEGFEVPTPPYLQHWRTAT